MTDDDGSSYVYLKKDGKKEYQKQDIVCGATDGQYTEIQKGLKAGDVFYYDPMSAGGGTSESTYMDGGDSDGEGAVVVEGESAAGTEADGTSDSGTDNTGDAGAASAE